MTDSRGSGGVGDTGLGWCSGPPWDVELTIEPVGPDLVCRVHGGAAHVGAVTVAHWDGRRVSIDGEVVVGPHREGPLSRVVAHQLCRAAHTTVTCVCGIHYDGISRDEIGCVEEEAQSLAQRAARRLEDLRIEADLARPGGVLGEIHARAGELEPRVRAFLGRDVEELCAEARRAVEARGGGRTRGVSLFAPLYLSNACPNDCAYCGFRRTASFERRSLSLDEAVAQARVLGETGFGAIDLVTGEIPSDPFVGSVCDVIRAILGETAISRINLNMGALEPGQYRRLREAGATGYHHYQETYDPAVYREVHRSGHKRDMARRLEASLSVVDAGFEAIGLGVLLGLREPAWDLACLCAHASVLADRRPGLGVGFSLPRIQSVDEACDYAPAFSVDDDLFVKCVLLLLELHPGASVTLTTRESPAVRERLLPLGVTKLSAGVSTRPGGYTEPGRDETAQFSICDGRSLDEVAASIRALGLEPLA